jgi:16S rRNA (cytosine1402-N4)-methyltransferase
MSSSQLETSGRGFSFKRHEPLDMRMDLDGSVKAGDLVNEFPVKDLENILRQYGEERRAKAIARAIVRNRKKRPIDTSYQLALIVKSVFPHTARKKGVHPATRTFQALRIAVNNELENLKRFLNKAPDIVEKRGRVLIISYHSLEDRIVKQKMVDWESACKCPPDFPVCVCKKSPIFRRLFKKGIKPNQVEIESNPSARSAILRVAERI